jgi:hypothetical protein
MVTIKHAYSPSIITYGGNNAEINLLGFKAMNIKTKSKFSLRVPFQEDAPNMTFGRNRLGQMDFGYICSL